MKLRRYIDDYYEGTIQEKISKASIDLDVSYGSLYSWYYTHVKPSIENCQWIEKKTRGKVTKAELRPDVWDN